MLFRGAASRFGEKGGKFLFFRRAFLHFQNYVL